MLVRNRDTTDSTEIEDNADNLKCTKQSPHKLARHACTGMHICG